MMTTILTQENIILTFAAALITMTISFTFELSHTIKKMGDIQE